MSAVAPTAPAASSGLALDAIGDLPALLATPKAEPSGRPLELALELIEEDPNQPRKQDNPGFSVDSLKELAATIRARGIKTPISVRVNPHQPGRYIINHGARRVRASRMAEKTAIPAYVDNDYSEADQVIENLQRNDLTPREIADFIGRELAKGFKKGEIAKRLGKSAAFVSQHVTLLDLPEPIAQAFNSGRTGDVTVVNELVIAYKGRPIEVADWLADPTQEITRGTVRLLREYLADKTRQELDRREAAAEPAEDPAPDPYPAPEGAGAAGTTWGYRSADETDPEGGSVAADDLVSGDPISDPDFRPSPATQRDRSHSPASNPAPKRRSDGSGQDVASARLVVEVVCDERTGLLALDRLPSAPGLAWIRFEDGTEVEAHLTGVRLVALVEATG